MKPHWKIEVKTGDQQPHVEWLELYGYGRRFRYQDREEAEAMLVRLQRIQPHAQFRIAPMS